MLRSADNVDFLRFKRAYVGYWWWKTAFYVHVFSAIAALLAVSHSFPLPSCVAIDPAIGSSVVSTPMTFWSSISDRDGPCRLR